VELGILHGGADGFDVIRAEMGVRSAGGCRCPAGRPATLRRRTCSKPVLLWSQAHGSAKAFAKVSAPRIRPHQ